MNISSGEVFVASIILIGIAVMLRIVRMQAAFFLIGVIFLAAYLLPLTGAYAGSIPTWLFVIIVVILGISLLRGIVSILFGRDAANNFVGGLLGNILTPLFQAIGRILRGIFRIR